MSDQYGPQEYGQPEYGPAQYPQQPGYQQAYGPYGVPPRSGGAGATITAAALAVVFAILTGVLAYIANHPDKSSPASAISSAPLSELPSEGGNGPRVNGTGGQNAPVPSLPPAPTLPSTTAISSPPPLDAEAINRVFELYMNALLDHDLGALHSATCPRLRSTEVGFELHGNYVRSWRGNPYTITPGLDFVTVSAFVKFRDPNTGAAAGSATYRWNVERFAGRHYYVCGFLS